MVSTAAVTMGTIMEVAAVLEMNMERTPVAAMKPAIMPKRVEPQSLRTARATRRWSPALSTAMAMMRPPRNMKLIERMYSIETAPCEVEGEN